MLIEGLAGRLPAAYLSDFIKNPAGRYLDDRHPLMPMTAESARGIAAYLLLWSKPSIAADLPADPITADEIEQIARRLGVTGLEAAAKALLRDKGCSSLPFWTG